jgi:hypothetical protein
MTTSQSRSTPLQILIRYSPADSELVDHLGKFLRATLPVSGPDWKLETYSTSVRDSLQGGDCLVFLLSPDAFEMRWPELERRYIEELEARGVLVATAILRDCEPPPWLADRAAFDFRSDFAQTKQYLSDFISNCAKIDFTRLNGRSFELMVAELLRGQGFEAAQTVQSPKDNAFDIVAHRVDPSTGRQEMWLIETKLYREQRPDIVSLREFFNQAESIQHPVRLLLITNSHVTSVARNWLTHFRSKHGRDLQIIEGPELRRLLGRNKTVVDHYFADPAR